MFKELTNFSLERSKKNAFGFYLAWLVVIMLVGGLFGGILGTLFDSIEDAFSLGLKIGAVVATLMSVYLSIIILKSKDLLDQFSSIIFIIITGILASFGGGLLGLIIPSYLSTRASKKVASEKAVTSNNVD